MNRSLFAFVLMVLSAASAGVHAEPNDISGDGQSVGGQGVSRGEKTKSLLAPNPGASGTGRAASNDMSADAYVPPANCLVTQDVWWPPNVGASSHQKLYQDSDKIYAYPIKNMGAATAPFERLNDRSYDIFKIFPTAVACGALFSFSSEPCDFRPGVPFVKGYTNLDLRIRGDTEYCKDFKPLDAAGMQALNVRINTPGQSKAEREALAKDIRRSWFCSYPVLPREGSNGYRYMNVRVEVMPKGDVSGQCSYFLYYQYQPGSDGTIDVFDRDFGLDH